jgi:hypothetical protein
VSIIGLALRAGAAGFIRKDRELATTGPYAHTRNPLYLGSFVLGVGISVAGGRWQFVVALLLFFIMVYRATVRREDAELEERFGERYRAYRVQVPSVLPRIHAYREGGSDSLLGFSTARYLRNREWEALLGAVAAFGALLLKLKLWP